MAERSDGRAVRRACHHVMCVPVCKCVSVPLVWELLHGGGEELVAAGALPLKDGTRLCGVQSLREGKEGREWNDFSIVIPAWDLPLASSPGFSEPRC